MDGMDGALDSCKRSSEVPGPSLVQDHLGREVHCKDMFSHAGYTSELRAPNEEELDG